MYSTINELYAYKIPKSTLLNKNFENDDKYEDLKEIVRRPDLKPVKTYNPNVWGPLFWKTLHISSVYYPVNASPIVRERMKNRILALPYELPCDACRSHCIAFVESKDKDLDEIVNGRENLVKFYLEFHNAVNKRFGKEQWTLEQVYNVYSEGIGFQK